MASAGDQLVLRRIVTTLAAAGLPAPIRAVGNEELMRAVARAGGRAAVVVLGCDVGEPARVAVLRRLHRCARDARIVVVSPATDATGVRRVLDAGADGVVFELELEATLAASVGAVAAGQVAVPRRLRAGLQKPAFSHRERQVLAHVAAGLTNGQIADALFLSQSTVKSHLSSAYAKLGVRSRNEAAALVLDPDHRLGVAAAKFESKAP